MPLVLGGVRFDYDRGLAGHSDGDVLAHALVDAVLGAAGLGDIGSLFPSDDARYHGASSLDLLREAYRQVEEARLEARQRRLHSDRRAAEDRPAARGDAATAVGGARRRRGERAGDDHRSSRLHRTGRGPRSPRSGAPGARLSVESRAVETPIGTLGLVGSDAGSATSDGRRPASTSAAAAPCSTMRPRNSRPTSPVT